MIIKEKFNNHVTYARLTMSMDCMKSQDYKMRSDLTYSGLLCYILFTLLICIVMIMGLPSSTASSHDESPGVTLEFESATPGHVWDVEVEGDTAYLATSGGVVIMDVSNINEPELVSFLIYPELVITQIAYYDDHVLVVGRFESLRIIDVSDKYSPVEVGNCSLWEGGKRLEVSGENAFVTNDEYLYVIDISNLTDPKQTGRLSDFNFINDFHVLNDYVYLADSNLYIIDISNKSNPQIVGEYEEWYLGASGITVDGDHAFVSDSGDGLWVLDVSDKTDPRKVKDYDFNWMPGSLEFKDDYLYAGSYYKRFDVIDVKDVRDAKRISTISLPGPSRGSSLIGDRAYYACQGGGVRIFDLTNKSSIQEVGKIAFPDAIDITIQDDIAYVLTELDGLQLYDISAFPSLEKLGEFEVSRLSEKVIVKGDYVYLAEAWDGFRIIDVSKPNEPFEASNVSIPGFTQDLEINNTYAYLAAGAEGIFIVDISDPREPNIIGNTTLPETEALVLTVLGDYAYVGCDSNSFWVVNINNRSDPQPVRNVSLVSPPTDVGVYGEEALITGSRLKHVNIIENDKLSDYQDIHYHRCSEIELYDEYAVIGNSDYIDSEDFYYLQFLNMTAYHRPRNVGNLELHSMQTNIEIHGNYIYTSVGGSITKVAFNIQPQAIILSIFPYQPPGPINEGVNLTFTGVGKDRDGTIVNAEWNSSLDGDLGSDLVFTTAGLSPGGHFIDFRVQDNMGNWSEWDRGIVRVNGIPEAIINYAPSDDVPEGLMINLSGSGIDFEGGVVAYRWNSSLDGIISTEAIVWTDKLSSGHHTLTFQGQDWNDAWSSPAICNFTVLDLKPEIYTFESTPSLANEGDPILFRGGGKDASGSITRKHWFSSLDGNLSDKWSFTSDTLSPGNHTISLRIMDDEETWSEIENGYLTLNAKPKARIDSPEPQTFIAGRSIRFRGSGTDFDGRIVQYNWSSDRDGHINSTANFQITTLSPGSHTISFRVMDNQDLWSETVTVSIIVNTQPKAQIISISANQIKEGSSISVEGKGNDTDGKVVSYLWSSSIDGDLGTSLKTTITLSPGTHTIAFQVKDDLGNWSEPATITVEVEKKDDEGGFLSGLGVMWPILAVGAVAILTRYKASK